MSAFELTLTAIVGGSAVMGYVLLLVQSARQNRRIAALQQQLDVFVDTSINVARCVDRLTHEGGSQDVANVASRRVDFALDRIAEEFKATDCRC